MNALDQPRQGSSPANRSRWTESPQLRGWYGLNPFGPAVARHTPEVFETETFEEQVGEASAFIREAVEYFTSRGYLPRNWRNSHLSERQRPTRTITSPRRGRAGCAAIAVGCRVRSEAEYHS